MMVVQEPRFRARQRWREREEHYGHRREVRLLSRTVRLGEPAWMAMVICARKPWVPKTELGDTVLRESVLRAKWERV